MDIYLLNFSVKESCASVMNAVNGAKLNNYLYFTTFFICRTGIDNEIPIKPRS